MNRILARSLAAPALLSCTLAGCAGGSAGPFLGVTAPAPSSLKTTPATLAFTSLGASANKSFGVSETAYTGAFTESDTCGSLAKVASASASGPSAFYQVTPIAVGACTITITDAQTQKATVAVTISALPAGALGALTTLPVTLTFTATGAIAAQTFFANETGYTGAISETDTCSGVATVGLTGSATGASVGFKVTPSAAGTCVATVVDSFQQTANVAIGVSISAPGVLSENPATLTFNSIGAAAAQTFAASETGYTGTLSESDTCSGIATIAPTSGSTGPTVGFTVTPVAVGSCTSTVSDSSGQKKSVTISVTTTGLGIQ